MWLQEVKIAVIINAESTGRKKTMIFDMHCDTISRIREEREKGNETVLRDSARLCINLEKLRRSGYGLQNFAVYIDQQERESRYENAIELVHIFEQEMEQNRDLISQVTTAGEIEENLREGRLSAMLTLEEGGMCEGEIEKLHEFHSHGARMLTLTWNYENELGYSAAYQAEGGIASPWRWPESAAGNSGITGGSRREYGLKEKGFHFLEEMEHLRMIPDVSHLSDDGFWDVYEKCTGPFVASHSNARALCGHYRNLTDEMLHAMGERGCVAGLNFYPVFLTETEGQEKWLDLTAAHAVHMIQKGGRECIGLGTDFDGFGGGSIPEDAADMDKLIWAFHRAGLTEDEIEGILYRNVLRLYRDVLG